MIEIHVEVILDNGKTEVISEYLELPPGATVERVGFSVKPGGWKGVVYPSARVKGRR